MLSTNYSPVVNMVCRGMILATVAIGFCAIPIWAVLMICDTTPRPVIAPAG
jgi:hypothetical protein